MKMGEVVRVGQSQAEVAFAKVQPLIEQARQGLIKAWEVIISEHDRLSIEEQPKFLEMVGRSARRLQEVKAALIDWKIKEKMIGGRRGAQDLGIEEIVQISKMSPKQIQTANEQGVWNHEVLGAKELRRFRETGTLPKSIARATIPSTADRSKLGRLKAKFRKGTNQINVAYGTVSQIRAYMQKHDIQSVGGIEVKQFGRALEKLMAEVAAADPELAKRAIDVLRGNK